MIDKGKLEEEIQDLLNRTGANFEGSRIDSEIYSIKPATEQYWIHFNDENMQFLCAGYAPCSLYDAFERIFQDMGFEFIDADGASVLIEKVN